jgi:hypothetical protein
LFAFELIQGVIVFYQGPRDLIGDAVEIALLVDGDAIALSGVCIDILNAVDRLQ